jgi:acyl carrier protein
MDKYEIESRVKEVIGKVLEVPYDQIMNSSYLVKDLGADSFNFVELDFEICEEFQIKGTEDVLINVQTVQDVIDIVVMEGVKK